MSSPISRLAGPAAVMLITACQQAPEAADGASNRAAPAPSTVDQLKGWVKGERPPEDKRPTIYCAVGAAAKAQPDCRIEIVREKTGRTLILSLPDGGFRRIRVAADGALSAADGAIEPRSARTDTAIGVVFGDERYAVPVAALTQ